MKQLFTKAKLKKIETLCRKLIILLGDDPDRPGMIKTPERYAKACAEWFEGMQYTNEEIAEKFNTCFDGYGDDLQLIKGIPVFSHCEHHMALMYDMKVSVAYFPKDKVLGLSKIARIADMVARRLQLQERIGTDIASIMTKVTGSEDVAVVIEGCHSCVTSRGIKKNSSKTVTTTFLGKFKDDVLLQNQLLIHLR